MEIAIGIGAIVFILLQKNKDEDAVIVKCVVITHMMIGLAFNN